MKDANGDNESDDPVYNEPWPDPANATVWMDYALRLLRAEINCCLAHAADGEYGSIAVHLPNLASGIAAVMEHNFVHLCSDDEKMMVVKQIAEQKFGVPFNIVNIPGVGYGLAEETNIVPDTIDELFKEGEGEG